MKKQKINKDLDRTDIELTDDNIDKVCAHIYQMRGDMIPILELQDQLRTFMKNKDTTDLLSFLAQNR